MNKLLATALVPALLSGCMMYEPRERVVSHARNPLSVEEVIALYRGGSTDETIQEELSRNGVQRPINVDDIVAMKDAGVSEVVIKAAIETPVLTARAAVVEPRVVYRDYYYSNDSTWFGTGLLFGYALGGSRHYHGSHKYHYGPRW